MNNTEIVHTFLKRCRDAVETRDWVSPTMEEVTALSLLLCAPAVQATVDADVAAREITNLIDRETYSPGTRQETIAAIISKAVLPKAARDPNLKWGMHDGRGEYHIEWHAPCGCAYHPEPNPHVHPCIKHSPIEDTLHELREMWLNFPGLSFGSLSIPCIQEMSPEQADFYEKACEVAKSAAVSGDKQEKERE